jgi:tetratricopeptide (TPR) repeat protein
LHQLVNKSLVAVDQRGETTRYRMLETIRQYADEKLQECGESETTRARHFACYLAIVENALSTTLLGVQFYQWCNEVKADLDNVRAAFAWSQTQADGSEKSLRLATGLGLFWEFQLDVSEGSTWLESALAHADPENPELTSWGIVWLAYTLVSATPRALGLATEALQRFTALNQPAGIALANLLLGRCAAGCGESAKAIDCLQDALSWFEAKQSLFLLERTYFYLGDALVSAEKREQALHYSTRKRVF